MVLVYTEYREKEKRLILALILALVIGLLEVVGGIVSNSLALISDSIHVFMDAVAIAIALVAVRLAIKPHTPTLTYGYHRVEVLAAFINTALAVALSIILLYETYMRLLEPRVIDWGYMLMIAVAGFAVNIIMLMILKHGQRLNEVQGQIQGQGQGQGQKRYNSEEHDHGILIKSVSLHIVSDLLGSLAVISAGAVIALTSLSIVDVIASVIIVGLILRLALQMLKRCIIILLEGAPEGIDIITIMDEIKSINGVVDIHDVHIWSIAPSMPSLSAHVTIRNGADAKEVMRNINAILVRYGIKHTTVQIEEEELIRPDRLGLEQEPGSDSQVVRQPRDLDDG